MNSREKSLLFHQLGQLLRSGIPLQRSLEKMRDLSRGETRSAVEMMSRVLAAGGTSQEAISAPPAFAGLDSALLSASDKSGHLERGLAQTALYYETMAAARTRVLTKLAYPIFILHLAGVAFTLPMFFDPNATSGMMVWALVKYFGILWALLIGLFLLGRSLAKAALVSQAVDRGLRMIPVVGKLRQGFAISRFCLAYDMQLDAGINVFSALEAAARASGGATYIAAARRATAAIREGETVSGALDKAGGFPVPLLRAMSVGEDTGQLQTELRKAAEEYRDAALRRIEIIVEWFPKVVLIFVALYIGWQVVNYYTGMLRGLEKIGSE